MTRAASTSKFNYGIEEGSKWEFIAEDLGIERWTDGTRTILLDVLGLFNAGVSGVNSVEILNLYDMGLAPKSFYRYIRDMG